MATLPEDIFQPEIKSKGGISVLILTANKVEDVEFFYPYYRLIEAGFNVDVATPQGGEFKGKHNTGLKKTKKITDIVSDDYHLLYIPGGEAPSELKTNQDALTLTKQFVESGKPVAALCHGPQVLAAAGVIAGRKIAAWPEVESEVEKAGATYINQETVVDGQFITGRWPADLPSHLAHTLQILQSLKQVGKTATKDVEIA